MDYELIKFNVNIYNEEFLNRDNVSDLFDFCYEEINKLKDDKIYFEAINKLPSLQKQKFIFELCDRYVGIHDQIIAILNENMLYDGLSLLHNGVNLTVSNPLATMGVTSTMMFFVLGVWKILHFYQVDILVKWEEIRNALETFIKADDRKAKLALIDSILTKNRFSCQELCDLSTDNTRDKLFGLVNSSQSRSDLEKKRISQHLFGVSKLPIQPISIGFQSDYITHNEAMKDRKKAECLLRCYLENLCIVIAEATNIYNKCLDRSGLHYIEINPEVINIPVAKLNACVELRTSLETLIKLFRQIIKTYSIREAQLFNNPNTFEDFWLDVLSNYIKQAKYGKHMKYINKSDELVNDTVITAGKNNYSNINYTK